MRIIMILAVLMTLTACDSVNITCIAWCGQEPQTVTKIKADWE